MPVALKGTSSSTPTTPTDGGSERGSSPRGPGHISRSSPCEVCLLTASDSVGEDDLREGPAGRPVCIQPQSFRDVAGGAGCSISALRCLASATGQGARVSACGN